MPIPVGMICRATITINGVTYRAKDYGKKAFCFFPSQKGVEDKKATFIGKVASSQI